MKPVNIIVGIVVFIISLLIFYPGEGSPVGQSTEIVIGSILSPILFIIGIALIISGFIKK